MKFIKYFFLVFFIAAFVSSCDKKDDAPVVTGDNLQTVINGKADLSLFKAAMTRAKLNYFLDGPGPFTVFAPNNSAFNAAGIMSESDLNLIDTNTLVTLLTYHFQSGSRTAFEIPNGPNANISTQGGFSFYSSRIAGVIYINGAQLVEKDIPASNGIIHVINALLVPPVNTSLTALMANPNHKLFVQAINKSATTAVFTPTVTVFAPSNAAMIASGYDSTMIANLNAANTTILGNIVRYHVVNGRIFSSELKDGSLRTIQGTNVILSSGATKIKGTSNAAPFNIVLKNIAVSNGVIHTIDGLLKF